MQPPHSILSNTAISPSHSLLCATPRLPTFVHHVCQMFSGCSVHIFADGRHDVSLLVRQTHHSVHIFRHLLKTLKSDRDALTLASRSISVALHCNVVDLLIFST